MKTTLTLAAAAMAFAVLGGCNKPAPSSDIAVTTTNGPALPVNHPAVDILTSRSTNRISISQLRGTLTQVFGNDVNGAPITWHLANGTNGLDTFSLTLGEPDYIVVTDENLEPSPLYLKFMDDVARDVCNQALTADYARTDQTQRVLLRYVGLTDTVTTNAAGVDQNLKYLKLRFHGIHDVDDASLAALRKVFTTAGATSAKEGWRGVCVALTTAPEFHFY